MLGTEHAMTLGALRSPLFGDVCMLTQHPGVRDAAVIGLKDDDLGMH